MNCEQTTIFKSNKTRSRTQEYIQSRRNGDREWHTAPQRRGAIASPFGDEVAAHRKARFTQFEQRMCVVSVVCIDYSLGALCLQ